MRAIPAMRAGPKRRSDEADIEDSSKAQPGRVQPLGFMMPAGQFAALARVFGCIALHLRKSIIPVPRSTALTQGHKRT